jgi:undecaprenyl diphosphate synthase
LGEPGLNKLPVHIGIIMDGNRRWAKAQGSPAIFGHKKGSETLEKIINALGQKGVKYATFFAFSAENWNRTKEEVDGLMLLFLEKLTEKAPVMDKMGAKVTVIGRKTDFSDEIQAQIAKLEDLTAKNDKITINFAFSYGGKAEIIDATKKIIESGVPADKIDEKLFDSYIYESGQPEPDMIIRTGGEKRLSGFMLWQSTYAELYFTDTLWPDFNEVELDKALNWYSDIKRNFGK